MNDKVYKKGVLKDMDPLYIVASQLNTLMALGIATTNVSSENTHRADMLIPDVYM